MTVITGRKSTRNNAESWNMVTHHCNNTRVVSGHYWLLTSSPSLINSYIFSWDGWWNWGWRWGWYMSVRAREGQKSVMNWISLFDLLFGTLLQDYLIDVSQMRNEYLLPLWLFSFWTSSWHCFKIYFSTLQSSDLILRSHQCSLYKCFLLEICYVYIFLCYECLMWSYRTCDGCRFLFCFVFLKDTAAEL